MRSWESLRHDEDGGVEFHGRMDHPREGLTARG